MKIIVATDDEGRIAGVFKGTMSDSEVFKSIAKDYGIDEKQARQDWGLFYQDLQDGKL